MENVVDIKNDALCEVDSDVIGESMDFLTDVHIAYGRKTRLTLKAEQTMEHINLHMLNGGLIKNPDDADGSWARGIKAAKTRVECLDAVVDKLIGGEHERNDWDVTIEY